MLTFLAILVLIVKAPFLFLQFLFKHRVLALALIVIVVVVVGIATINGHKTPAKETTVQQQAIPKELEDLTPVQTPNRIYYVVKMKMDGATLVLLDYYVYNSPKWDRRTDFPVELKEGEFRVYSR